jgi:hypothetical protein
VGCGRRGSCCEGDDNGEWDRAGGGDEAIAVVGTVVAERSVYDCRSGVEAPEDS